MESAPLPLSGSKKEALTSSKASEYWIGQEREEGREKVYKTVFSLDLIEEAYKSDLDIKALFPNINISEIRETVRNEHFFENYCFSLHLPQKTLALLNEALKQQGQPEIAEPLTEKEMLRALKLAMINKQILKHINTHGWSAGKEVWEIDEENGQSFTAEQIKNSQAAGQDCMVINFDSNGWGESVFAQAGNQILEQGPRALKTITTQPAGTKGDQRDWVATDPEFRRQMPGSIEHAAETKWLILNSLFNIAGPRIYWGHSQGEKIVNKILSSCDLSSEAIGVGLAGAQTGRNFRENELSIFSTILSSLERIPKPLLALSEKIGATSLIAGGFISHFALANLPPKAKDTILKAHLKGSEKVRQLITQLYVWAYVSDERLNPRMFEYGGAKDKIIPSECYKVWAHMLPGLDEKKLKTASFYSYPNPCLENNTPHLIGTGHYFFLNPKNQRAIVGEVMARARDVFSPTTEQEISSCCQKITQAISGESLALRLAVVPDKLVPSPPLAERIEKTIERAKKQPRLTFPFLIPISQGEMIALKAVFAGQEAGFPGSETLATFLKRPENEQIERDLKEAKLTKDSTWIPTHLKTLDFLINNFPFDWYLAQNIPEEEMQADVEQWVGYQQQVEYPKPPLSEAQVIIIKEVINQIYASEKARLK